MKNMGIYDAAGHLLLGAFTLAEAQAEIEKYFPGKGYVIREIPKEKMRMRNEYERRGCEELDRNG